MAPRFEFPSDEAIVKGCLTYGSASRYAEDGLGIAESTMRRYLKGHPELREQVDEALSEKAADRQTSPPPQPGDEVTTEEKLQHENTELKAALKKVRSEEVGEQRVLDALRDGIDAAEANYTPTIRPRRTSGTQEPHTLALLFSDAHAGEKVSLTETNGLNEYDWPIMMKRLQRLAEGVRSHRDHYGAHARKLHITSLGDGLSGSIHEELRETNDPPFAQAIVEFGTDVADWVAEEFGDEFEDIRMDCVIGNHPRFSTKPRAKVAYDNGDWIAGCVTRERLRQYEHITVNVPMAAQTVVEICSRKILLIHGDGVRTTMAGVPWGGIIRHSDRLRQLFALSDVDVDHVFGGHWHNPQVAEDRSILINGSVKGVDEFSLKRYGGGKPPTQLLAAFHPKWGLTGVHFIDLDGRRAAEYVPEMSAAA